MYAITPSVREHFAPLRLILTLIKERCTLTKASTSWADYQISRRRTGKRPSLTQMLFASFSFHVYAGTEGPIQLLYFPSSIRSGCLTCLSSQRGYMLVGCYPSHKYRSPDRSLALAKSYRNTPHGSVFMQPSGKVQVMQFLARLEQDSHSLFC